MKKIICLLLSVLMLVSAMAFVGCSEEPTLKMGVGVFVDVSKASDATADKAGEGKAAVTAAIITVDEDGKVVACQLDTAETTVKYDATGKAQAVTDLRTKYEKGTEYNMVAYGNATKEWFEQADAFETLVVGKTLDEIKALVAEGDKGTADVIAAGCTIMINEFVGAIEKAFANLAESTATAESALKLGMNTAVTNKDATADKAGQSKVETTVFAAAVDAEGKVLAAKTDCAQITFTFNNAGASTYDLTKAVATKREQGMNYNMVAYGGATMEWFEQADAFEALCVGKTAAEIAAFCAADNYGTADVKAAGCTILVDGFTKAAAKIG